MIFKNPFSGGFRITSPYGERTLNGKKELHKGIDIVGKSDKSLRSVCKGRVAVSRIVTDKSNPTWQWGNYVSILGEDGLYYYYCHLESRAVKAGDTVEAGDVLGIMGNTGYSFGAHTHLEIRKNGKSINAAHHLGIENRIGEFDIERSCPSHWAKDALSWALEAEIIKGKSNGDLAPKASCTREEIAVMLYRFYNYLKGETK